MAAEDDEQEETNLVVDMTDVEDEMSAKVDSKVDYVMWKHAHDDLNAAIQAVREKVSSLRLDLDARLGKTDEDESHEDLVVSDLVRYVTPGGQGV